MDRGRFPPTAGARSGSGTGRNATFRSHQGPATVDNISLRCRAHNVYESELVFGRFDPLVVREATENYAVSREFAPFRNGGSSSLSPGDDARSAS